MKIKLTLVRPGGSPAVDVVVSADVAAPVSEVASALLARDSVQGVAVENPSLRVVRSDGSGRTVSGALELGEAPIASGATIMVVNGSASGEEAATANANRVRVSVTSPGARASYDMPLGSFVVGRDSSADIVIEDPLVSKNHARLDVMGVSVRVVDLNSANGVVIDGDPIARADLGPGQQVMIGDSLLEFEWLAQSEVGADAAASSTSHIRSPRVEARYAGAEFIGPELPSEQENQPFPWLAMIAPVIVGGVLFAFTHSPMSLVFVALSPVLLLGNFFSNKANRRRKFRLATGKFRDQISNLDKALASEVAIERASRLEEAPSTGAVVEQASLLGSLLWTRRPEHWNFMSVRLGLASQASRNSISLKDVESALPEFLEEARGVQHKYAKVDSVPVSESLFSSGALGIAGSSQASSDVARAVLAQLAGLHSPTEVVFAAIVGGASTRDFEWLKWLPHTSSAHSPLSVAGLANSAPSASALLADLEGLIAGRSSGSAQHRGALTLEGSFLEAGALAAREPDRVAPPTAPAPAVILLVTEDAPADIARLVQIAERGVDAGVYPIWIASSVDRLPAATRTFVDADAGEVSLVRAGAVVSHVEVEKLAAAAALSFARRLAGVSDASAYVVDESDLPRSVNLLSLVGSELAIQESAAIERWTQNESIHDRTGAPAARSKRAGRLRAIVGHAGLDPMHLDLRTQGPHALVGGTTGSGKSEFLQAWVLGMAIEYSPDRLTFLFVDYKGGSAFADCVRLPHSVGLVTDLSPHLVRRALTSLRAELHHRERLLARKKVKDLIELERTGDIECPPALVIVIDEFAALVGDVPEFVDGVVDIAQRGRSLGIHLILATQRPAGVIRDNLRANTNLRIALRMADESDSTDVVGSAVAAAFDPSIPGRAIAKTGPGRLASFQAAYAGGWTSDEPQASQIDVAELRFGSEVVWERPQVDSHSELDQGPTDQYRLVDTLIRASSQRAIPEPRRPWLDLLPRVFDLTRLRQRTDTELLLGVRDVPERQVQEEVYFQPDVDGNIAIYGTSGSGKSVTLRTLAVAAGITPRGGPVDVYGIDFGNGGLSSLEVLPHVGSIVGADEPDRIVRTLRMLKAELDDRASRYSAARAGSIVDYRSISGQADERRILLLIDGFPAFRQEFEGTTARAAWYAVAQQLVVEGRQLGIHVALTADRPGSVPSTIGSNIQRRVVLRMAEDSAYMLLDSPADILTSNSPPGRAIVDGFETQIALAGSGVSLSDQAQTISQIGDAASRAGHSVAVPIGALQKEILLSTLPSGFGDQIVLGVGEETLAPVGTGAEGVLLIAGPPGSGRSNALRALTESFRRARPETRTYYLGNGRSNLPSEVTWTGVATTLDDVASLAKRLTEDLSNTMSLATLVVIESTSEFLSTPADAALVELVKTIKRSGHSLIAESETSTWTSSMPLLAEIKSARRGLILQPENLDGDTLLKTSLPRGPRSEFPPGRAFFVERGRYVKLQIPIPDETVSSG